MNWNDVVFLIPEIVISIGAMLLLITPVLGLRENPSAKWSMIAVLAITAGSVIACSWAVPNIDQTAGFAEMFALDSFSIFFKLLLIAAMVMVTLLSDDFLREARYPVWEYYSLLAFALCGMMFMVSGTHLISIYIGLELMSLSSYILAGFFKNEQKSTDAAMKYFILGAGLCFKVAAEPFHVWTPDVYEGAPTPITAFLSTASKAAAFAIFARIFYSAFHHFQLDWSNILATISALSMVLGNLAAITQDNVKRMLAYSSISHAGYGLLGILSLNAMGLRGVLIYTLVYVFANLGIWATVLMLRRHEYAGEKVDDFDGLHRRAPFWSFAMVIFLLSLGGIPPTAGFIGKYFLFAAAVQSGFGWLAIIAVLMSAVSMFYYLRLVVAMYLRDGREADVAITPALKFVAVVCLVVTLALGILPTPLIDQAISASQTLVTRATVVSNAAR